MLRPVIFSFLYVKMCPFGEINKTKTQRNIEHEFQKQQITYMCIIWSNKHNFMFDYSSISWRKQLIWHRKLQPFSWEATIMPSVRMQFFQLQGHILYHDVICLFHLHFFWHQLHTNECNLYFSYYSIIKKDTALISLYLMDLSSPTMTQY